MYFLAIAFAVSQASQPVDRSEQLLLLMQQTAAAAERAAAAAERSAKAAEKAVGVEEAPAAAPEGEVKPPPSKVKVSGSASLSLVWLAGNSNAITGQANVGLSLFVEKWTLSLKGNGAYGQARGPDDLVDKVTALNVAGELRGARNFTDIVSVYILGGAGHDAIARINWRAWGEAGLGLTFFKVFDPKDKEFIRFQFGTDLGLRYQREDWFQFFPTATEPRGRIANPQPNIVAIKVGLGLRYAPIKNILVQENLELLPDVLTTTNFVLNNVTALVVKVIGPLSLSTSFTLKFDNLPPPGAQKLDTILAFGADVAF
jgi:hypothetical protein